LPKKRVKGETRREEKKLRKLKRKAEMSEEEEGTKTYSMVIGRSLKNKKKGAEIRSKEKN